MKKVNLALLILRFLYYFVGKDSCDIVFPPCNDLFPFKGLSLIRK